MQLKRLLPLFLIITVANVRATVPAEARAYEPEAKSYEPAEALMRYIQNGDTSYRWAVVDSTQEADIRAYRLQLTSQTWRGIPWNHELVVLIPRRVRHREALLHISGGGEDETTGELHLHGWDDGLIRTLGRIAHDCQAVCAVLWQVPRQPLFGGLREDELVSYTFHQYQKTGDTSWPLLFPMAKSALRAMDAVSELAAQRRTARAVDRFVVNGVSKRGWTTWMAAATGDRRIVAIAPMVIDVLNMPVNIPYQRHMYGRYSPEIQDYVNLGITETITNPEGRALVRMVDPYSYRHLYTMPKLLFMGTNDPFWTVDAVKNYIGGIPSPTLLNYTPNAGHDLGGGREASLALEAFFHQTIHGARYPSVSVEARRRGSEVEMDIRTGRGRLCRVELWQAESPTKDFRQATFSPTELPLPRRRSFRVEAAMPASGFKAFFVRLYYRHPAGREPYTLSTRMFTASNTEFFEAAYNAEQAE